VYDVLIVGGGPAGLNAALVLGRCRRRVLVIDKGEPRNAPSRGVNGFLTRDGCKPQDLRRIGRGEIARYETVEVRDGDVVAAQGRNSHFAIELSGGERFEGRKLLLATGLHEDLPLVEGFAELFGHGVWNCPYCDGWEHRDQPLAVYGKGKSGKNFALELTIWSRDLVYLTDGPAELSDEERAELDGEGIRLDERKLARLEGGEHGLDRIVFTDGEPLARAGLFFIYGERAASELVSQLGCDLTPKGTVPTHGYEKTNVPGLYAAGDASRRVQFAIVAAAEGAMAAFAINTELLKDDLKARGERRAAEQSRPEARTRGAGA
jgi:thioredoxin reductase